MRAGSGTRSLGLGGYEQQDEASAELKPSNCEDTLHHPIPRPLNHESYVETLSPVNPNSEAVNPWRTLPINNLMRS